MEKTKFQLKDKGVEMSLRLPFKEVKGGSDFDIDAHKVRSFARALDVLGTYSVVIIQSLDRRMTACCRNLLNHLNDIIFNDGCHISYQRKDGSIGTFNVPSFQAMEDCKEALLTSNFKAVLKNVVWVDQIIKALLNDRELLRDDSDTFKFSELVSLLCEVHAMGPRQEN